MRTSLKLNNGTKKKSFIFGFDGKSDRPDPLHLTAYIPIAWAEIPVRIEQIYLDSPDSSLPRWYWSVTIISWVSLLKQRVNLADAFPCFAVGRKARDFTVQTYLHQWVEWKHIKKQKMFFLKAAVVHSRFQKRKAAEGSPKAQMQVSRVSPNTASLYRALSSVVNHLEPRFCSCYYHRIMLYVPMALLPDRNEQPVGRREHHPRSFVKWNSSAL